MRIARLDHGASLHVPFFAINKPFIHRSDDNRYIAIEKQTPFHEKKYEDLHLSYGISSFKYTAFIGYHAI